MRWRPDGGSRRTTLARTVTAICGVQTPSAFACLGTSHANSPAGFRAPTRAACAAAENTLRRSACVRWTRPLPTACLNSRSRIAGFRRSVCCTRLMFGDAPFRPIPFPSRPPGPLEAGFWFSDLEESFLFCTGGDKRVVEQGRGSDKVLTGFVVPARGRACGQARWRDSDSGSDHMRFTERHAPYRFIRLW